MTEEKINLSEYTFDKQTLVELPGELLIALLDVLTIVEQKETTDVLLMEEAVATLKGKIDYKQHTSKSFFSQTPKSATTIVGASVMDMKFNLLHWFLEAVKAGKAIKKHEIRNDE